jgi:hypothetical protein
MAREIISGDAGTTWQNDTGRVKYQFVAALINTCGVCLQYHLKISASWPIPIHYNCRCIQVLIKPGAEASKPFCDYRELLDSMDDSQKVAAIGMSNYRLLKSGVVKWEDIVSPNRVRDFREVVAKKKLTVEEMVRHGVKKYQAEKAYNAVHTAEHEHVERQRRELLGQLTGAGLSQEQLVRELGNRLATRVTIAAGPTGPEGPAWGASHPWPHTADAAALVKLISGYRPGKQKVAMKPLPSPLSKVEIEQRPGELQLTFEDGKKVVIRPGESAHGLSYEEWLKAIMVARPPKP